MYSQGPIGHGIEIASGGLELLEAIRPLRERLFAHHGALAERFRGEFTPEAIAHGDEEIRAFGSKDALRIDIAKLTDINRTIAYCISVIHPGGDGEVYSMYVDEAHRNSGLGARLVAESLRWFEGRGVEERYVSIMAGNDRALAFYERIGFRLRRHVLKMSAPAEQ